MIRPVGLFSTKTLTIGRTSALKAAIDAALPPVATIELATTIVSVVGLPFVTPVAARIRTCFDCEDEVKATVAVLAQCCPPSTETSTPFPPRAASDEETCAVVGVVGALAGVIGSMMAVEAIKLIVGAGEPLTGRLLIFDALAGEARTVRVGADPRCPVCG